MDVKRRSGFFTRDVHLHGLTSRPTPGLLTARPASSRNGTERGTSPKLPLYSEPRWKVSGFLLKPRGGFQALGNVADNVR